MELITKISLIIFGIALIAILMTFPVMWIWNWLMPKMFGLMTINFWEALCLNLLCGALFKQPVSQ